MKRFGKVGVLLIIVIVMGFVAVNLSAEELGNYPSKPITITSAFSVGGSTDLNCRALAAVAPKYINQPIVCVAKPGGAGLVSLQHLKSCKPDGYTYHLGRPGNMTVAPLIQEMSFNVFEEFVPIGHACQDIFIFAVNANTPWKTIEDLIEAAKKEPGKIRFASSSATSYAMFIFEKFCREAGIRLTHVPFKGASPATIAVSGGHVPVLTASVSEVLPAVRRGDLRVLLVLFKKRVEEFPDVPCAKEKGYEAGYGSWNAVFAPKGVPPAILSKFEGILKKIVEDQEFVSAIKKMGGEPYFVSSNDFADFWRAEQKWLGTAGKEMGLIK